jgi:hypothetical protein
MAESHQRSEGSRGSIREILRSESHRLSELARAATIRKSARRPSRSAPRADVASAIASSIDASF